MRGRGGWAHFSEGPFVLVEVEVVAVRRTKEVKSADGKDRHQLHLVPAKRRGKGQKAGMSTAQMEN